ncbi:sugar phosphate isomerase/epimerase family protein [Aureliella helgolandensis]|uniref:Xylose isomerase-like TIM barrel n=1 Tax=Aureliella helgolandensis TaxID=2527968 RepID=A0A518G6X8_9BACT|nr:sugar phosphate isomerase/epimerase family protein [Aureliella helgolandensis]QDV24331.1 Xylose isomerase-like TIM barrel [Aureliella helgolandensis]
MPELNIGIGLRSLRQSFKKALHTAASVGATGVEIDARNLLQPKDVSDTGRRQLRKLLDDLNLRIVSIRFPTHHGYDVLADLERRIDATKEAMRFAYSLGANVVVNAVGYVPEDPLHPAYLQLQESLGDLARFGQHIGTLFACETGSEPVERLTALLDSIPDETIGVAFNPGNLIVNDFYDEESIERCAAKTLIVNARDGVRDLARGRGLEVPLGRGSADFPRILGVLEERRYRGWYILDRVTASEPTEELGNAAKFLKAL